MNLRPRGLLSWSDENDYHRDTANHLAMRLLQGYLGHRRQAALTARIEVSGEETEAVIVPAKRLLSRSQTEALWQETVRSAHRLERRLRQAGQKAEAAAYRRVIGDLEALLTGGGVHERTFLFGFALQDEVVVACGLYREPKPRLRGEALLGLTMEAFAAAFDEGGGALQVAEPTGAMLIRCATGLELALADAAAATDADAAAATDKAAVDGVMAEDDAVAEVAA